MEIAKIKISGTSVEVSDLQTVTSGMVGATVGIEYDSTWDGLNKQVVFKTSLRTINAVGATIPHELLQISGSVLRVGVYGYTEDGTIVIPTVYANLGRIMPGADPEGDEAAKPTNPIWMDAVNTAENADGKAEAALESAASAERKAESAFDMASAASERAGAASVQASAATEQAETAAMAASAASRKAAEAAEQAGAASDRTEALAPRVEALETNISQADWNVNDETDPAYIKNRPFYMGDPVLTEIFPETTVQFDVENGFGTATLSENFSHKPTEGELCVVNWDGVDYRSQWSTADGEIMFLGNLAVMGAGEDSGEPFLILSAEATLDAYTISEGAEHTISLAANKTSIKKIDKAYLPDTIGNPGTGVNAETFNGKNFNIASGDYSHAEGFLTEAGGNYSHSEGEDSRASGENSHAEGRGTTASGYGSHSEGGNTRATEYCSHAEGNESIAKGSCSHAEGNESIAAGSCSHAEGSYTTASGYDSHAEGY